MRNVRMQVFETNSSSTHSISVTADTSGIYDTLVPDSDGKLFIPGGKFGWEWARYNDAMTKARYAAIDSRSQQKRAMLDRVIMEQTGARSVSYACDYDDSYIDHQSVGTSHDAFVDDRTLRDFLFSPQSWLFTGNDNSEAPANFYEVRPMLYTYGLEFDGQIVEKFTSSPFRDEAEKLKEALERLVARLVARRQYDYCYYICVDECSTDGEEMDSFRDLQQQRIELYKYIYDYDANDNFCGLKVEDRLTLHFRVVKLQHSREHLVSLAGHFAQQAHTELTQQ